MDNINQLWLKYNEYTNKLAVRLKRTNNIVGEYAEHLSLSYYGGKLLNISGSSSDLVDNDGKLYQIKSRRIQYLTSSQLGIIRSWDFHFLVVILFNLNGGILKAMEVPVDIAKEYGVRNDH